MLEEAQLFEQAAQPQIEFVEPPFESIEQEEIYRQQAEANGELDHIIPDLRPLAVRMIRLNLDPLNAQEHDARNLKVIAGSLQAFGQRDSLTVNWNDNIIPNRITAGNGRYIAAKMIGWRWIAVVGTKDSEADAMAWGHLDNRSAALSKVNYNQASQNLKTLRDVGHPILSLMYTDEEALPLLREDFEAAPITNESFDSTMLRGRSISKITASERLVVDQGIEFVRTTSAKALTEGSCLEFIVKEFLLRNGQALNAEAQVEPIQPVPQSPISYPEPLNEIEEEDVLSLDE